MAIEFNNGFATESGLVTVYNVNSNGEYIGTTEEWVSAGTGLPANCYIEKALNPRKGYAIVRNSSDKWEYIEDHRNEKVYSKEDGTEFTIQTLGPIPDKYTTLPRPSEAYTFDNKKNEWVLNDALAKDHLSKQQEEVWEQIKAYRAARAKLGVHIKSVDKWFETGEEEKIKILGLLALVDKLGLPSDATVPGFDWATMDNTTVPVSKDLLLEIITEMAKAENADHLVSWEHHQEMLKVEDPTTYDYKTNWVPRFNESGIVVKPKVLPPEPTPASATTIKPGARQ